MSHWAVTLQCLGVAALILVPSIGFILWRMRQYGGA